MVVPLAVALDRRRMRPLPHRTAPGELGGGGMLDPGLVSAAREVLSWDEKHVWDWWPGASGEVARAWRACGRMGEDAAAVITARLDPDLLARYEAERLDEDGALTWCSTLHHSGQEGGQLSSPSRHRAITGCGNGGALAPGVEGSPR